MKIITMINTMDNTYEYVSDSITAKKDKLQKLSMNIVSLWMENFKEEKPYYIADISKQKERTCIQYAA